MARTRITITGDASNPKTVHLGSGVAWYAYLRSDYKLYAQREVNKVRDPEVLIAEPVVSFDVARDPVDPNIGWIYFVHDGTVERARVTPLSASFNGVEFTRGTNWAEVPRTKGGTGMSQAWLSTEFMPLKTARIHSILGGELGGTALQSSWVAEEGPEPPTIALWRTSFGVYATFTLPNTGLLLNRGITRLNFYRRSGPADAYSWYAVAVLPEATNTWEPPLPAVKVWLADTVPPAVTYWAATCVRTGYQGRESAYSVPAIDDGNLPFIYVEQGISSGSTGMRAQWAVTDKTPIKKRTNPHVLLDGTGPGGTGMSMGWKVNGLNIITP